MLARLLLSAAVISPLVYGEVPEHPWPEVTYQFEHQDSPAQDVHIAVIDLSDGHVQVRVSRGGKDPDGPGKWQTTLMTVPKVAAREKFDIAINGDFFTHLNGKDAEGAAALKMFPNGIPGSVSGPAMTDGEEWATASKPRPCLVVTGSNELKIVSAKTAPADAEQVLAGHDYLVQDGNALYQQDPPEKLKGFRGVNPRTAIGIDKTGTKLFILVNDGRRKDSLGMNFKELAAEMQKIGCYTAINLDGGGSATFVVREADGKLHTLNKPSDGHERAVANVLGVTIK